MERKRSDLACLNTSSSAEYSDLDDTLSTGLPVVTGSKAVAYAEGGDAAAVRARAATLVAALDNGMVIAPPSDSEGSFDIGSGYATLGRVDQLRRERGWRPVGRKLGFTDPSSWARSGVTAPIWAHLWDRTVVEQGSMDELPLRDLLQPRIEPELVLELKSDVPATDDEQTLLSCIASIAPAFELVQCPYRDWRFTAADAIAAGGLHGALIIGERRPVDGLAAADALRDLRAFEVMLSRDGAVVDRGHASNVLGGPLVALGHLARLLDSSWFEPLRAGEVVTTGTLTRAWPVGPDETWSAEFAGLGLGRVEVTFSA